MSQSRGLVESQAVKGQQALPSPRPRRLASPGQFCHSEGERPDVSIDSTVEHPEARKAVPIEAAHQDDRPAELAEPAHDPDFAEQ